MAKSLCHRIAILVFSAVCLLTGGLIYLLFRSKTLLMFSWVAYIGGDQILNFIRDNTVCDLPDFVLFCLPDFLWTTSYILLIDAFWVAKKQRLIWASIIPIVGMVSEILQYVSVMPGTYDFWDLCCYSLPFCIYFILLSTNKKENL